MLQKYVWITPKLALLLGLIFSFIGEYIQHEDYRTNHLKKSIKTALLRAVSKTHNILAKWPKITLRPKEPTRNQNLPKSTNRTWNNRLDKAYTLTDKSLQY